MQNQTPHSLSRAGINFVFVAVLTLIVVMAFTRCSSEHKGCQMNKGMIGYGAR